MKWRTLDMTPGGTSTPTSRVPEVFQDYLEALIDLRESYLQKRLLKELVRGYVGLEERVSALLANTLPRPVADEIKISGRYRPRQVTCSILFTDLVGFTSLAQRLDEGELIRLLDGLFSEFDRLTVGRGGTKIKTMGDAYMAVFGAPRPLDDHAVRAVGTGLEMIRCLRRLRRANGQPLRIRVGVHSGQVIAGVVGRERMQFDVFGEVVNTAARYESSGVEGRVNVSETTRSLCGDAFTFEDRGVIVLKNMAGARAFVVESAGDMENEA